MGTSGVISTANFIAGRSESMTSPSQPSHNPESESKQCCVCGVTKPYAEFHKDRATKSGYSYICKVCREARRQANLDEWLVAQRKRSAAARKKLTPEQKLKEQEQIKQWMKKDFLASVAETRTLKRIMRITPNRSNFGFCAVFITLSAIVK